MNRTLARLQGHRPILFLAAAFLVVISEGCLEAAKIVVIGDSLSAEYEAVPDFPGLDNPTEYARVTVPGWESMSWVEVLGKLRPNDFDFGRVQVELPGWPDLRFSGFEFNFAIPGFTAAKYEDIVNSSFFSNPQYLSLRSTLAEAIRHADGAVIWLGANEFRAQYGFLYDGGDPSTLLKNLAKDLEAVVDFVQAQKPNLSIVLVTIPDMGAAPVKQAAHPDLARRARATAATLQANEAIAQLAVSRKIGLADVFSQTRKLIEGEISFFGAVNLIDEAHLDNHPRYHFTRDGLHPNTPSQLEIARMILAAFNAFYGAGLPQISDGEALAFLGLDPNLPYAEWISSFSVLQKGILEDPDQDGWVNLAEYAFGADPSRSDRVRLPVSAASGWFNIVFTPDPSRARHVRVWPQFSEDLRVWIDLPETNLVFHADQTVTARVPLVATNGFLRLHVSIRSAE